MEWHYPLASVLTMDVVALLLCVYSPCVVVLQGLRPHHTLRTWHTSIDH